MDRLLYPLLMATLCVGVIESAATVSLLKPEGIRFSLPDEAGISLVSFHYSINEPLDGVSHGQVGVDVNSKTGSEWVHEDTGVTVHPGDKVNYWYLVVKDGEGHTTTGQQWIAAGAGKTTATAATREPTTQVKPIVTQGMTHNVQVNTDKSTSQASQSVDTGAATSAGSNTGTGTQPGSIALTPNSNTAGVQVSGHSQNNESCSCSSVPSIRPPGSELGCHTYPCLIFADEFDTLDLDVWEHEITAGGGGNWEFEYYTNNRSNSYVRDGKLFIKPTMTVDALADGPDSLTRGALDIWGSQPGDICTGNAFWGCRREGNANNILNPIQSARLRSARGFNFKYGTVEIRAKMPTGDWLWPAIWMLPLRNAYGRWPASGEIDIVESRGNTDYTDANGNDKSVNSAGCTLHFGSDYYHNKFMKAHGERLSKSGTYGDSFHIYTMDWEQDHLIMYIDGDEVLNVTPPKNMWEFGGLDKDGVENPWINADKMAPFDQEFFFILNVAVGGTAYFPDHYRNGNGGKPWSDSSATAPRDFWNGRSQWLPSWQGENAAMQVDYIRVWKMQPPVMP